MNRVQLYEIKSCMIMFMQIIEGSASPSPGFTKIPVDLNKGTLFVWTYLYLCWTKSDNHQPLTAIEVIQGDRSDILPAEHPETVKIDTDCNKGARGKYVYICYRHC